MSRQELADAVNAYLWSTYGQVFNVTDNQISKLERGTTRWPHAPVRRGFREVLGVTGDAGLGFYNPRSNSDDAYLAAHADGMAPAAVGPTPQTDEPMPKSDEPVSAVVGGNGVTLKVEATDTGGVRVVIETGAADAQVPLYGRTQNDAQVYSLAQARLPRTGRTA